MENIDVTSTALVLFGIVFLLIVFRVFV